ncbi:copper resistance protein CopC [Devosia sp.]|uniref:copper resistance CopC/CopD family protein n=1 Tax=Devosia sp. TaxID=1871048 RepID=UPI0032642E70
MPRSPLLPAIIFWLCLVGSAFAHASLVDSSPTANAVLAEAPAALSLQFNEPVSPLVLTLFKATGAPLTLTDFKLVGSTLEIVAPAKLGNGTFVLSYRVISTDGHPVGGSIVFSIGAPSVGFAAVPAATDWSVPAALWMGKIGFYAGLFFGVGGAFFRVWLVPVRTHASRPELALLITGMIATPILVGLQGLDALGLSLPVLVRLDVWQIGFATSIGPSAALACTAMVLALLADRAPPTARRALSLVALVGIGLALTATGHAASADPQWLTRPAVFIHALAIAFWAGALLPLATLLRTPSPATLPALQRFSRTMPFVLALLVAAGTTLAVIQLGSIAALITTAYGIVLVIKLALFVALLILAACNRWRLTTPAMRGKTAATKKLVQVIVVEIILIFGIQGVTACWRFTPPPRAMQTPAKAPPLDVHIHTDQLMAQVSLASGGVGSTSVSIFPMAADFGPVDPQALTLVISNPSAGIEPIRYATEKQQDGSWLAPDVLFPIAGTWTLRLDIRVSDFQMISLHDTINLMP